MNYFPKSVFFLLTLLVAGDAHTVLKEPSLNQNVEMAENLDLSVELLAKFHSWAGEHEKSYSSDEEKVQRLKVWMENDGTWNTR